MPETITIPLNDRSVPYVAEGGETELDLDYPVMQAPIDETVDVRLYRRRAGVEAELVYETDFTMSGIGTQSSAKVILVVPAEEDDIYVADGARAPVRITNHQNHRSLKSTDLNDELNRMVILLQEARRDFGRALKRSPTAGIGEEDAGGWDMQGLRLENMAQGQELTDGATIRDVVERVQDAGGGNMSREIYDPTNKGLSVFAMDSMDEGADTKIMTAAERADIAATKATLAAYIAGKIGTIDYSLEETAPAGWLLLSGADLSRTTHAALFAKWGTRFGVGDGSTTFGTPDGRGVVLAGRDDMGGAAAGRLTTPTEGFDGTVLGSMGGAETHQLTAGQLGKHKHFSFNSGSTTGETLVTSTNQPIRTGYGASDNARYAIVGTASAADTGLTSEGGNDEPHNNVQPTMVVNLMVFTGVFS